MLIGPQQSTRALKYWVHKGQRRLSNNCLPHLCPSLHAPHRTVNYSQEGRYTSLSTLVLVNLK